MCGACANDRHEMCTVIVPTGHQVPDRDGMRDRTRMVPEFKNCSCGCQDVEVPF